MIYDAKPSLVNLSDREKTKIFVSKANSYT